MFELAIECGIPDQFGEHFSLYRPFSDDGDGLDARLVQDFHSARIAQEMLRHFVVDIEFKKIVCQLAIVDGVFGIHPFAEENVAFLKSIFE